MNSYSNVAKGFNNTNSFSENLLGHQSKVVDGIILEVFYTFIALQVLALNAYLYFQSSRAHLSANSQSEEIMEFQGKHYTHTTNYDIKHMI